MNIHIMTNDALEAQGIRWVIESHFTGVSLSIGDTMADFKETLNRKRPNLVIFDMDGWEQGNEKLYEWLHQQRICWIGISSERIFQTAYRALRFRAEDVLFRPFSPEELIKHVQQLRYQSRNEQHFFAKNLASSIETYAIDYPDLFLKEQNPPTPITMIAFLTPNVNTLQLVYDAMQRFPIPGKYKLFALSDFILSVHEMERGETIREIYHSFLTRWKERMDEPLAIVINMISSKDLSFKKTYQQTRQLTKTIFFEGYDIILVENEQMTSREMDPFLTPLEQRQWIEMLEKQDIKAIREWVEHEFLTYVQPYPDPEMVRIRLTSVLAQIRRHMKSYHLQSAELECTYHEVFQYIVHQPVIYQIIQELLSFTVRLLQQVQEQLQESPHTLVEKARELIESNYWDAGWNLAACADVLRMNKSTLSRRFAAESGQSFRMMLHQVRIREAKRLLQETDIPLEEVARLSGYSHQTYFNAKFKQAESCTPSAYRSGLSTPVHRK